LANIKKLLTRRWVVQSLAAILINPYYKGFVDGTIYRGRLKNACVPVLNCYSCPGAVGSCPVGALQAVAVSFSYSFSFYVAGFLGLVGITTGRLACGWVCPFGFMQDLLYRIPTPKFTLPRWMRGIKYFILVFAVLLLPALIADSFGAGVPYFCKWLCPAGTLEAAVPLYIIFPPVRTGAGLLFFWRMAWLFMILVFIILIRRGFCQALCPLGAIYSFFNGLSFYTLEVDPSRCKSCHACQSLCFAGIDVKNRPNHPECIRCLECIKKCPGGAISWNLAIKNVSRSPGGARL
jgi:polyferredoxin